MEVEASNVPDTDESAGATPAAAGATPAQTTPVSPAAAAPASPATGEEALGDAGKRALDAMKAERDAAKREAATEKSAREKLENATASDADKALKAARAEGAAEVTARWSAQVRRSEVKSALTAAGINQSVLDLAINAAEFSALKVTDEGEVEGLPAAIEAFKKAKADLFTKPAVAGSADGGTHGSPTLTRDQISKMKPEEINARWDEVSKALPTAR